MTALNRVVLIGCNGHATEELGRLLVETDGQDVIEYALLTAFIGFAGAAAWGAMRTSLGLAYGGFTKGVWDAWEPKNPGGGV